MRQTALFEIKRKSGIDDDSDVDLHEDEDSAPVQVASAAGLARLAPNGLLKQTDHVDVACLKPSLVRVLKTVERHYGRKMIVTSGYRSPAHNRRARGAKNSLHMYCAAADIQVPGVSKWELAAYFRSMPGRGGVGTYCHTKSVHIDVGPERDWNWRCRRRKAVTSRSARDRPVRATKDLAPSTRCTGCRAAAIRNYKPLRSPRPSSSGPGRRPFTAVTRVRVPLGVPIISIMFDICAVGVSNISQFPALGSATKKPFPWGR